jgi:excisionase family DNA binding protein
MNEKMTPESFLTETITIIPVSQILPLLVEIKNLVQNKSESSQEDKWYNLKALCNYHPDSPAKQTVYGWVNKGSIPVHKEGKKLRFLKSEIDEWLKRGKIKTSEDIDSEVEQYCEVQRKLGHRSSKTTKQYLGEPFDLSPDGKKKILQTKKGKL